MRKHFIVLAMLLTLGTGATLARTHAYQKAQTNLRDGNPMPLCPPPPYPCK